MKWNVLTTTKQVLESKENEWSGVTFPLVNRTFGRLEASEIVNVQPMSQPSGRLFYLDYTFNSNNNNNTNNERI